MSTIGQVAKQLNISVETIRFYQRQQLIEQPPKPAVGYRRYSPSTINRLRFILNAKQLGFSLAEIKTLLALSDNCTGVEQLAQQKLNAIDHKIEQLTRLKQSIESLTQACHQSNDDSQCPLINSLLK